MSRRECRTAAGAIVVVGWDPPLQTFFGQVYRPEDDEYDDGPSVWVGAEPGVRLQTLDALLDALGEWAGAVSGATRLQLLDDQDNNRA